jgi:hypothetical protein
MKSKIIKLADKKSTQTKKLLLKKKKVQRQLQA